MASLAILLESSGSGALAAGEAPRRSGLTETARVDLVQIEVTVWPKVPGSDACLSLTEDDFELLVDGRSRPIYAVDAIGSDEEVYAVESEPEAGRSSGGMSLVLFFDLWHLDLFYRGAPACPPTKHLAFEEARRLVRKEFREGDRLLLVTFAGWPVVHYGWIRRPEEALAALDRLEKNRQVVSPHQYHLHHNNWIAGVESLFLALGRYPGRKDVIYLGDDFRFDDIAWWMWEFAARAQANGVVVSSIDLVDSCRTISFLAGGLAGTPFGHPLALGPISRDTGGELFRMDRIVPAVRALRSVRRCRYLVSFREEAQERKKTPWMTVRLRNDRKDVALHAPSSFGTRRKTPTKRERDEALFLLPRFGRGIGAEVGFWPYRPEGKRWQALALARVERTDEEAWPEELTEIVVSLVVRKESRIHAQVRKTISGEDLQEFRRTGDERLLVLPVEKVRPGETTLDLTVTADAEGVSAGVRKSFELPRPPAPGEAGPWLLSDRFVRLGDAVVRAPALDGSVSPGEAGAVMAYACRADGDASESYEGDFLRFAGGERVPVALGWVDPPRPAAGGCGWLVGTLPDSLPSGLWSFEPPEEFEGGAGSPPVEFAVESSGREVESGLEVGAPRSR